MGIDLHALHFLKWSASKSNGLGSVATIGRQGLHIPLEALKKVILLPVNYQHLPYCDELLKQSLGASRVVSFDKSQYEGADFVVDMNEPISAHDQYETVFDGGSLEHIYNVPQAMKNVSSLCANGGQILHVLPANNFCGHGFWQFSPELFFSLYSQKNGYSQTEVFIADLSDESTWYEVIQPHNGIRANVHSSKLLYVMCRTVKREAVQHTDVQQSDYIYTWNKGLVEDSPKFGSPRQIKQLVKQGKLGKYILSKYEKARIILRYVRVLLGYSPLSDNPWLIKRKVGSTKNS